MRAEFQNRQDYFTLTLLPNKMDAAQARTFFSKLGYSYKIETSSTNILSNKILRCIQHDLNFNWI